MQNLFAGDRRASIRSEAADFRVSLSTLSGWTSENDAESLQFHYAETENSDSEKDAVMEEKISEAARTLHEIFVEGCCTLYNDFQNLLADFETGQEICLSDLESRLCVLMRQAEQLAETVPELTDIVQLRLSTLGRAMEQLRIKTENESQNKNVTKECNTAPAQFRKWLQATEHELEQLKEEIDDARLDMASLQRVRAAQQVLQLQIETDGRASLSALLNRPPADKKKAERWRCNVEGLEHRWRVIWLRSLEQLELIHHRIEQIKKPEDGSDCESISWREPLKKRRRTASGCDSSVTNTARSQRSGSVPPSTTSSDELSADEEDVIPFKASEYERFDPKMTLTRNVNASEREQISPQQLSDVEFENTHERKEKNKGTMAAEIRTEGRENNEEGWSSGSRLHDVGYSSGENSIHEALSGIGSNASIAPPFDIDQVDDGEQKTQMLPAGTNEEERRLRINKSPVKSYYKTVPLDDAGVTDTETPRSAVHATLSSEGFYEPPEGALTDSLIVQTEGTPSATLDDYEEVMGMMDDQFNAQMDVLRQGTQWREFKSSTNPKRLVNPVRPFIHRTVPAEEKVGVTRAKNSKAFFADFLRCQ
jgi:hypothetical protein